MTCPHCDAPLTYLPIGLFCPHCGAAYNHGDLHEPKLTRRLTVQIDNTTVEIALAQDLSGRDAAKVLKRACRALRKTYQTQQTQRQRRAQK